MPARHPATRARVWQRVLPLLASFSLSLSSRQHAATFPNLYSVTVESGSGRGGPTCGRNGSRARRRARARHGQPLRGTRSRAEAADQRCVALHDAVRHGPTRARDRRIQRDARRASTCRAQRADVGLGASAHAHLDRGRRRPGRPRAARQRRPAGRCDARHGRSTGYAAHRARGGRGRARTAARAAAARCG